MIIVMPLNATGSSRNFLVPNSGMIFTDVKFDFNQDSLIDFEGEFRSPGWERLKKNKILKWKK